MDYDDYVPATQAIVEDEYCQEEKNDSINVKNNTVIGTLEIENVKHPIYTGITTIGRHPESKIIISHETISKRHAEIEANEDKSVFIRDMKSFNKTKLNDMILKPMALYHVPDESKIVFGKILSVYNNVKNEDTFIEESFVVNTPQVKKKAQIIPSSPDGSMNGSITSDLDLSSIPGTQKEETCFRVPKTPVNHSHNKSLKSPSHATTLPTTPIVDFQNTSDESDIFEQETQVYENDLSKNHFESDDVNRVNNSSNNENHNIFEMETQCPNESISEDISKKVNVSQAHSTIEIEDHNIFEMETQCPDVVISDDIGKKELVPHINNRVEKEKHNIFEMETQCPNVEVIGTQSFKNDNTDHSINISKNSSIQNNDSEENSNAVELRIEDLETQKMISLEECKNSSLNEKSLEDLETQNFFEINPENLDVQNIQNLETQYYNPQISNKSIKNNSINTSKNCIMDLETQQFLEPMPKFSSNTPQRKSVINSSKDLLELETQQFIEPISEKLNNSIKDKVIGTSKNALEDAETEKFMPSENINEIDFENLETQIYEADNRQSINSSDNSLNLNSKLENLKSFSPKKIENEFIKPNIVKRKTIERQSLIEEAETQNFLSLDKSIVDTETQQFLTNDEVNDDDIYNQATQILESKSNNEKINDDINEMSTQILNENKQDVNKIIRTSSPKKPKETFEPNNDSNNFDESQNLLDDFPFLPSPEIDKSISISENLPKDNTEKSQDIITSNKSENNDDDHDIFGPMSPKVSEKESSKRLNNSNTPMQEHNESLISNQLKILSPNDNKRKSLEKNLESSVSEKKLKSTIPDSDCETDEEGLFESYITNSLENKSINNEKEKNVSNNKTNDETDDDLTDGEDIIKFQLSKSEMNFSKNNDSISDEDIFDNSTDKLNDKEQIYASSSKVSKINLTDSEIKINNKVTEKVNLSNVENSIDIDLEPTQIIITENDKKLIETEDFNEAPTQKISETNIRTENFNDAPTQKIQENKKLINNGLADLSKESKDFHLADTQILQKDSNEAPTQKNSENNVETEDFNDAPTQKIQENNKLTNNRLTDTSKESKDFYLADTQILQKDSPTKCQENKTVSKDTKLTKPKLTKTSEPIQEDDIDFENACTQTLENFASKRELENSNTVAHKKFKNNVTDLNDSLENNLKEMFDGSNEAVIEENSMLLTQQLKLILESSQFDESTDSTTLNATTSPTISGKRTSTRIRRRPSKISDSSNSNDKTVSSKSCLERIKLSNIDFNDTIEKNLNEMFDSPNKTIISQQSMLQTQQLENILQNSQDESFSSSSSQELKLKPRRLSLKRNASFSYLSTNKDQSNSTLVRSNSASNEKVVSNADDKVPNTVTEQSSSKRKNSLDKSIDDNMKKSKLQSTEKLKSNNIKLQEFSIVVSPLRNRRTINKPLRYKDSDDENDLNQSKKQKSSPSSLNKSKNKNLNNSTLQKSNSFNLKKKLKVDESSDDSEFENAPPKKSIDKSSISKTDSLKTDTNLTITSMSERKSNNENISISVISKDNSKKYPLNSEENILNSPVKNKNKIEKIADNSSKLMSNSTRSRKLKNNILESLTKNDSLKSDAKNKTESKIVQDKKNKTNTFNISLNESSVESKTNSTKENNAETTADEKSTQKGRLRKNKNISSEDDEKPVPVKINTRKRNNSKLELKSENEGEEIRTSKRLKSKKEDTKSDKSLETVIPKSNVSISKRPQRQTRKKIDYSMNESDENINTRPTRQTRKREYKKSVNEEVENTNLAPTRKTRKPNNDSKEARKLNTKDLKQSKNNTSSFEESQKELINPLNLQEKTVQRNLRGKILSDETENNKNKQIQQKVRDNNPDKPDLTKSRVKSQRNQTGVTSPMLVKSLSNASLNLNTSITGSPKRSATYKILISGEKSKEYSKIVKKLRGTETDDVSKGTILVTDKIRRTYKILCSIGRGIPIVSSKWLIDSEKEKRFLESDNYILHDESIESEYKFTLRESLEKAKDHKLFENHIILFASKFKSPPMNELKDMVSCNGGKYVLSEPSNWSENITIVTKKEDLEKAKKIKSKAPKSVTIQPVEFLLTNILRQDLDFNKFKLI